MLAYINDINICHQIALKMMIQDSEAFPDAAVLR